MTLLTIVQGAADEIGVVRPATVVGNTDPDAQRFLRLANKVGERLMKVASWQVLRKEQTFTALSTEVQTSILPSDFDRFVPETFWDRDGNWLIIGPVTGQEWQGLKANSYGDTSRRRFIYRGGDVRVIPTFSGGEALAFEYISNQWCESSGGAGQSAWAADTDVAVLDDELITLGIVYEYLDKNGLPTASAAAAYESRFNLLLDNDQPDGDVLVTADIFGGGRHFTGAPAVSGGNNLFGGL